MSLVKTAQ